MGYTGTLTPPPLPPPPPPLHLCHNPLPLPRAPSPTSGSSRNPSTPTLQNRTIHFLHAAAAVAAPRTGVLDLATMRWVYGRTAPGCKLG